MSLSDDSFSKENNFHISKVIMKVKVHQSEAGWVVRIAEVTEDDIDSEAQ